MKLQNSRPASREGGEPRLVGAIRRRISARGPIPFAEFMNLALYHPQWGYYARRTDPIGREQGGDYYTAPSRHPLFGTLMGRQVGECLNHVGAGLREVVEFGPGSGALAASLAQELARQEGGAASKLPCSYTLVEPSPFRRQQQRRSLRKADVQVRLRWITPQEWEDREQPVCGCLIANEVLDALPVHRLLYRNGSFQEIFVDWQGELMEVQGPVSDPALVEELNRLEVSPREGQELEVGLEAVRWIRRVAAKLGRGYLILIDYGYLADEMFGPRHHRGTLLAYHRHRVNEEYLERVGRQDLTAHVNFSSVIGAAREQGLVTRGPLAQGRFLLALGVLNALGEVGESFDWERHRDRQAIQDLFLPRGMGETHQVLVLATPGLEMDLTGLRPPQCWTCPEPDLSGMP